MSEKAKTSEILATKRYPNEHLNAGKPNPNIGDQSTTQKTSSILGEMTQYPKPITNDKAWKAK